jgi:O-antigen ligase
MINEPLKNQKLVFRTAEAFLRIAPLIVAIGVSFAVGYSLEGGQYGDYLLPFILLIGLSIATMAVPIEWILLGSVAAVMLADSYFEPTGVYYSYYRFLPLGMLAVRSLLAIAFHQVEVKTLPGSFLKPFGLFFLLATISALYDELNPNMTFLRALTMGFVLAGLGIGVPTYMKDERLLRRGLYAVLMLLGFVITLGFIFSPVDTRGGIEIGEYVRFRGLFRHPNTLGLMAMLSFFPVLGWWYETPKGKRMPLLALLIILLLALFTSGSRASLIGILCGSFVLVCLAKLNFRAKTLIISLFIAVAVLWVGAPHILPGMVRFDTGWRFELWHRAFELGMNSPLYGTGFGSTNEVFSADRQYLSLMGIYAAGSHNEFMRIFVGLGAAGLALVLYGFGTILIYAAHFARKDENPIIPFCLLAAVVSGMANAVFEDWIFAFGGAPAIPFWFFLTVLALYVQQHKNQGKSGLPPAVQFYPPERMIKGE